LKKIKEYLIIAGCLILFSCNRYLQLTNICDRELRAEQGDLMQPIKIIIHKDSTFEYINPNHWIEYAKGCWKSISGEKIILNSYNDKELQVYKNNMLDTVYLKFENRVLFLRNGFIEFDGLKFK
jgi:hypothetical protein